MTIEAQNAETETALQSLFWQAEANGLVLPTIPELYLDRLSAISHGECISTDPDIVPCLGVSGLLTALDEGRWPKVGMAMRLTAAGRFAHWQCLLVGRLHLVQIDLRLPNSGAEAPFALASVANALLSRHLSDEKVLSRYLNDSPTSPSERAFVVLFGNAQGVAQETHVTWSLESGLGDLRAATDVFPLTHVPAAQPLEEVILRP